MLDDIKPGLTRRQFLKASAATAAVVAVGDRLFGGPVSALAKTAQAAPMVIEDVWIKTTCDLCDGQCNIQVRRVNGVVVKSKGNSDDVVPLGRNCARSQALPMNLYNPYRVKTPLKRTNPQKGVDVDPKWAEISWDEALDIVAQKLQAIKKKDPRGLALMTGHRGPNSFLATFGTVFGTPNTNVGAFGGQACNGCETHTFASLVNGQFTPYLDVNHFNYSLNFGNSMYSTNKGDPFAIRELPKARDRGAKNVVVDPVLAPVHRNVVDEWIPIKPGTDLAFMLAMVYSMMHEIGILDVDFLKNRSNAPYLIGPDGLYVRAGGTLIEDAARVNQKLGKPYIWDSVEGKAKTWDDKTIKDFALEGNYVVDGVQCQPAFQLLKEHVRPYTPEWAEKMTTVPAATIRRISREFVEAAQIGTSIEVDGVRIPNRPAVCSCGRGPGVSATNLDLGIIKTIPNILVGNINTPGGLRGRHTKGAMTPNPVDGLLLPGVSVARHTKYRPIKYPPQRADNYELYPIAYKTDIQFWPAVLDPKAFGLQYEVEALGINGANPTAGGAGLETVRKGLAKIPFVFAISYNFDEPTEWSDIVFPESCFLERHALCTSKQPAWNPIGPVWEPRGQWAEADGFRQPVVQKPVFNTREVDDIITDLSEKVGILYGDKGLNKALDADLSGANKLDYSKKYTWTEILDRRLKSTYGDQKGLEWWKQKGVVMRYSKAETLYGTIKYPKTRVPIYFEYFLWAGKQLEEEFRKYNVTKIGPFASVKAIVEEYHPLPMYREQPDADAPAEYDLWVCHYKTLIHTMAVPMENAWLRELIDKWNPYDMSVWLNADTAAKKGLKDGDLVQIESRYGKTQGEVKTSQCVHPDAVGIGGCFGLHSANAPAFVKEGPSWNALIPLAEKEGKFMNPVLGGVHMHVKVKVQKA